MPTEVERLTLVNLCWACKFQSFFVVYCLLSLTSNLFFSALLFYRYNFCTHDNLSLCRFAFDIYDEDGSGFLDHDEIEVIIKELYGRRAFKKNAQAQKTMKQIEALEWSVHDNAAAGWEIDFPRFYQFCRSHPSLLYPAFLMQTTLQTRILGTGFWTIAAENRRQLENVLGCDNNLIDKLQSMHEEDQAALQRGGYRSAMVDTIDSELQLNYEPGDDGSSRVLLPAAEELLLTGSHGAETRVSSIGNNSITNTISTEHGPPIIRNAKRHRPGEETGSNHGDRCISPHVSVPIGKHSTLKREHRMRYRASGSAGTASLSAKVREDKAEKKALLKEQYKREMRASRRAEAKGKDPKKAAQKAKEKFTAERKKEAARKTAARPILQAKKTAIASKDAGAAWKCSRCRHANFATAVCATCKFRRGTTPSVAPLPIQSQKTRAAHRLQRGKTIT